MSRKDELATIRKRWHGSQADDGKAITLLLDMLDHQGSPSMTAPTPSGGDWPESFTDYDWECLLNDAANALDEYDLNAKEIRQGHTTMSASNIRALAKRLPALLAARRGERALRDAAKDCADDLESEIRARYGHPDIHPAMRQKYERDMEPVSLVRAALAATPERDTTTATQEEK